MIIGNNPCEIHLNFQGDLCPVCMQIEMDKMESVIRSVKELLDLVEYDEHGDSSWYKNHRKVEDCIEIIHKFLHKEVTVKCFYCENDIKVIPEQCPENPRWICEKCYRKLNDTKNAS